MKTVYTLFTILICITNGHSQAEKMRYPFFYKGLYGIMDGHYQITQEPVYHSLGLNIGEGENTYSVFSTKIFSKGVTTEKFGLLKLNGKVVFKPRFENLTYDGNGFYVYHFPKKDSIEIWSILFKKCIRRQSMNTYLSKRGLCTIVDHTKKQTTMIFQNGKHKTVSSPVTIKMYGDFYYYYYVENNVEYIYNAKGMITNVEEEIDFFDMPMIEEVYNPIDEKKKKTDWKNLQSTLGSNNLKPVCMNQYDNPFAAIFTDEKTGYKSLIDLEGSVIFGELDIIAMEELKESNYLLTYKIGDYWGLINLNGKKLLSPEYISIEQVPNILPVFYVLHQSGYGGISLYGEQVFLPKQSNCSDLK
ncbi:MAG: WG repeat-containing protein [Saprospiraceae bacterium]